MKKIKIKLFLVASSLCFISQAQKIWSLKTCMDTAFKKNILLNKGKLNTEIYKTNVSQSKAAQLPNLNLTDAHTFNSGYSLDPFTYQYTTQNINVNNIALTSSVTLFNGFLLVNTVKQNRLIYDAGVQDVEKIKNDLRLNLMAAYMQVLMDYEAIEVAKSQVDATGIQIEQTKKFVEFGKVPELNLLQVQSQLASDKLNEINAENQLQLDKITLLQLMDTPATNDFDIEKQELKDLFPETPIPTSEIDRISEGFLPEIKSAALKTNAAVFALKMSESGWLPKLTLGGTLRTGYSSIRSNITQNTYYYPETIGYVNNIPSQGVIGLVPVSVVSRQYVPLSDQLRNNFSQALNLTLLVPIFNNLQVKSNVKIAKINLLTAKLNEQQTRNDIRKSIETAYTNQVSAGKKLIATEEQMKLEKQTYENMEKKYGVGALDPTSFLIEKNNYNKVSISLIQAKYDYVLKTKIIDFYLGKPLISE